MIGRILRKDFHTLMCSTVDWCGRVDRINRQMIGDSGRLTSLCGCLCMCSMQVFIGMRITLD